MNTRVDQLLEQYVAEHRAGGEADPRAYLDRAAPADRRELAALIDAYLARAPRQPFLAAAFAGSPAERIVDELDRALGGQAGLWPALLPRLRDRAGVRRSELVDWLARTLGVSDRVEKVAFYYHQMEQGLLPSRGVSDRVLDALGAIVSESAQVLREAGRWIAPPEGTEVSPGATTFARRSLAETAASPPRASAPAQAETQAQPRDEIDALFTGG